jgi:hypothetical protein
VEDVIVMVGLCAVSLWQLAFVCVKGARRTAIMGAVALSAGDAASLVRLFSAGGAPSKKVSKYLVTLVVCTIIVLGYCCGGRCVLGFHVGCPRAAVACWQVKLLPPACLPSLHPSLHRWSPFCPVPRCHQKRTRPVFDVDDALKLVRESAKAKFDEVRGNSDGWRRGVCGGEGFVHASSGSGLSFPSPPLPPSTFHSAPIIVVLCGVQRRVLNVFSPDCGPCSLPARGCWFSPFVARPLMWPFSWVWTLVSPAKTFEAWYRCVQCMNIVAHACRVSPVPSFTIVFLVSLLPLPSLHIPPPPPSCWATSCPSATGRRQLWLCSPVARRQTRPAVPVGGLLCHVALQRVCLARVSPLCVWHLTLVGAVQGFPTVCIGLVCMYCCSGAAVVGAEDLVAAITAGTINFTKCIATPDMMPIVGRVARVCVCNPSCPFARHDTAALACVW